MPDLDLRMLLVEDQSDLRRAIAAILKQMGVQMVQNVATGTQALEILRENPIDFILCEWTTPELSGLELLRKLHHQGHSVCDAQRQGPDR